MRFWADGDEHVVAPVVAANVSVQPLPDTVDTEPSDRLTDLRPGEQAQVAGISRALRGPDRRRLMDLGFVPGTVVGVDMAAPSGDPVAYRVRGALIALRRDQARMIFITRMQEVFA
jgi:DtxR family Mn-dependent transcriptional regulator